jgi:MFS superfamily sulfate permease-like transporter
VEFAIAALNLVYLVLAVVGFLRWRRLGFSGQTALAFAVVAFIALRCALLLTLDNSEPRYTLECFPVITLLAGLFFAGRDAAPSGEPWLPSGR